MSIKQRQLYALTEKVLRESYQKGYIPSVEEVARKVNELMAGNPPGMPVTKYRPARSRQKSKPSDWNQTIEEILTDLSLLYSETLEQVDKILVDFDYYEVERRKLERRIAETEDRIQELLLLNDNADGYLYSVYDNFKTLNKIDLNQTEAWVDLNFSEVCLPYAKLGNTKLIIDPPSGQLLTTADIISSVDLQGSGLENIVDDSLNTYWLHQVASKVPQAITYKLTFRLNGEESTRLVIDPHVTGPTTFTARYTEDGRNWMDFGSSHSQEKIVYDFYEAHFLGIEIIITKREHDDTTSINGQNGFIYNFGLKNVSLYKVGFEETATFQSKALSIVDRQGKPVTFDQLSLEVDEVVPVDCRIDYFVALQTKADETNPNWVPDWQPLLPIHRAGDVSQKVIDLKSISSYQPSNIMTPTNNVYRGEPINGLRFYEMGSIPEGRDLMTESFTMYKGINQFKEDRYKAYWLEYGPKWTENKEPGIADWVEVPSCDNELIKDKPVIATKFTDITNELSFYGGDQYSAYRFITNIYHKEAAEPTQLKLQTTTPGSKLNVAIYVNGNRLELHKNKLNTFVVDNTGVNATLAFNQGWNSVLIFVYKHDNLSTTLKFNLDLLSYRRPQTVRAEMEPMLFVPLFDYLYNTYEKEADKYSISEDNKLLIGEYQREQNAKYLFSYRYRIDQGYTNKIFLMANLQRGTNPALSPKLKFYKLRVV